jgi:hypothetical protein
MNARRLPAGRVEAHRRRTYRLDPALRLRTLEGAIGFVEERGFVTFWPIKGVELPSLWWAVAGERPVAAEHDDPGHVTWRWKDSLLGTGAWYYAKVLRGKATLLSMSVAPLFYALTENFGDPQTDYLIQYEQGRMSKEAKSVYEALLREGPLHTVALRRAARLAGRESRYRFGRAMQDLQADFKILPVGIAAAGAWKYAYVYDLVPRHLPELPERARAVDEAEARREITYTYLESVGAARVRDVVKVTGWSAGQVRRALAELVEQDRLREASHVGGQAGAWMALPKLFP